MRLQYDIAVTGRDQLRSVLHGVERDLRAHARQSAAALRRETGVDPQRARRAANDGWAQLARAGAAAARREERERVAAERRIARERLAGIRKAERESLAATRRVERENITAARRAEREAVRAAKASEAAARREAAIRARTADRMGKGFVRTATGGVRNVAGLATTGLSLVGGFAVGNAISEQVQVNAAASRLANQAGNPALKGELAREASSVQGFSGAEVLSGMEEFVTKTGDLGAARKMMGSLAELSLATGASLGDLGATAGQAFNVLKDQISDPIALTKELNAIMGSLAQQGALGAVEIRDLARDFGKLGAATRAFEGDAPDLIRTMGAFAQIAVARGGAEGSADASTAAARLASDIVEPVKRKRFAALGVDIKSKVDPTKLRSPIEIMADVLEKTGGDIEKTSGLFGIESAKIFKGLGATFSEAEKRKKGSGRSAVMAEFERFAGARVSADDIRVRAQSRLSDEDLRFKEAVKAFNREVSQELLPALTRLTPAVARLAGPAGDAADALADFIDFARENPYHGIGALIAGLVAKDLAAAGIGKVAEAGVAGLINRMGGGAGSAGAAGAAGAAGTAGKAAAGAALRAGGAIGAAVGGTLLAYDQLEELGKEVGSKRSVFSFLPGFNEEGTFETDQLKRDVRDPLGLSTLHTDTRQGMIGHVASGSQAIAELVSGLFDALTEKPAEAVPREEFGKAVGELRASVDKFDGAVGKMAAMQGPVGNRSGDPISKRPQ